MDGYAVLERTWQDGDAVEVTLALPIQGIVAHPFVSQLGGRVAIQRGPLVYCVEGVDQPGRPEPTLAAEPRLDAVPEADLLGGVLAIRGQTADGGALLAVPYYAWDNRRAADQADDWMAIWLRQSESFELRVSLDGDDRRAWADQLYQPLPATDLVPQS